MRLTVGLPALLALLLLTGCAQRTYIVYPPKMAGDPPSNSCIIDFREVVLGEWTVGRLRKWAAEAAEEPRCKGLELRFHRPGQSIGGKGLSPPPADGERLHQLILDSAPERPALKYPPIIRAVVGDEAGPGGTGPNGTGTPAACPLQCPAEDKPNSSSTPLGTPGGTPGSLAPSKPEPEPGNTGQGGPEEPQPPLPPAPDPGPEATDDDDDGGGRPVGGSPPKSEDETSSALAKALPSALLGGGLVYALALMNLLPFAGAPARLLPSNLARPSWSLEKTQPEAVTAPAGAESSTDSGDRRVRLRSKGFEE